MNLKFQFHFHCRKMIEEGKNQFLVHFVIFQFSSKNEEIFFQNGPNGDYSLLIIINL